jgi:seryl-tRNA synthetase
MIIYWPYISQALMFYQEKGYKYIEVPWIVQNVVNMITCPDEDFLMKIDGTYSSLVGSAEQGFLALQMNNGLAKGKYVSCSPCFRNEKNPTEIHRKYFMKVELYQTNDTSIDSMYNLIQDAQDFFDTLTTQGIQRVATNEGIDLNLNGIEIGSYGIKSFSSHKWIYGTGLALPRFTQARQHIE